MKISKEIRLALLGIVAIVLFVLGFNYLKGSGMFSSSRIVRAEYDNAQGITPSSFVQLQGFNVGSVYKVSLSEKHPGKVLVEMSVDKKIFLPEDTRARIVSLDLLGTKAVALVKGSSTKPLGEEQLMPGEFEQGTIESLGASAGPAIDQAKLAISSLDTTIRGINNVLDASGQQHLRNTLANIDATMSDFRGFAKELNAQSAKINSLVSSLNSFAGNLEKNNQTVTQLLQNAESTTGKLSRTDFEGTVAELKKTLDGLQQTLNKINNGNGSLALLMNDDKLYRNLKNTLSTANNLIYDINARPSRYINVNIFGKKQKNECPPQPAPNAND